MNQIQINKLKENNDVHENEFVINTNKHFENKCFEENNIPSFGEYPPSVDLDNKYNLCDKYFNDGDASELTVKPCQSNYEIVEPMENSDAFDEKIKNIIQKEFNFTFNSTSSRTKNEIDTKSENNINIYTLYIDSLKKINDNFDPLVITNILELKLLDNLGIKPIIDSCVVCGNTNNIVTISSYKGGYLCNNCVGNEKIYLTKTIKLLRMLYYVDISKIEKIEVSDKVKNELNEFIDDYYDRYSGLYLKTKSFLKNLNKIK